MATSVAAPVPPVAAVCRGGPSARVWALASLFALAACGGGGSNAAAGPAPAASAPAPAASTPAPAASSPAPAASAPAPVAALDCSSAQVICVSNAASGAPTPSVTGLQAAADRVQPGTTVQVYAGRYAGFTLRRSGTAALPIRVVAVEAGVIVNRGDATSENDGIRLQNVSHVQVEGFDLRNEAGSAPRIHRCIAARGATADSPMSGNRLRNNVCSDADAEGLYASQFGQGLIEGNQISRPGRNGQAKAHGIYLANAGSDGTTLRGNTITGAGNAESEGIHINGDLSIGGDGLVSGLVIENNLIYANAGNNGINLDGVQSSVIRNNLVYGNAHHALRAYAIDGAAGPQALTIVNNSFIAPGGWAVKLTEDGGGHIVFNNLLGGTAGALCVQGGALQSDRNMGSDVWSRDGEATTLTLAGWRSATGQDSSSQVAGTATLYSNAAAGDYGLAATSPARDRGLASFAGVAAPSTDRLGQNRPRGAGIDLGALEAAP